MLKSDKHSIGMSIPDAFQKPNWLLWGLIILSLGIHLLMLVPTKHHNRSRDVSRIELTLKQIASPHQRQVPKPMSRLKPFKVPHEQAPAETLDERYAPTKPPAYVRPDPVDSNWLTGKKQLPRIPAVENTGLAEWQAAPETLTGSVSSGGESGVIFEMAYTKRVQKQIEAQKEYPKRAQRRNEQGVVVILFSIGNDGDIVSANIIKSSGSRILDRAGIDALKKAAPFEKPPKIPMNIQLPIRFELL